MIFMDGSIRKLSDPVQGELEYTDEEIIFMKAVEDYRIANRRRYPSLCEILQIAKSLGYEKVNEVKPLPKFNRVKNGRN